MIKRDIKHSLMEINRVALQYKLFAYLKHSNPWLKIAEDSKMLDRAGIDLFVPYTDIDSSQPYTYSYVIQCKGFENNILNSSQLFKCSKSIRSFVKSDYSAEHYILAINQVILPPNRGKLQTLVDDITKVNKASKAEFLDIYQLVEYIVSQTMSEFTRRIIEASQSYYNDYIDVMSTKQYYADVPFDVGYKTSLNPLQHIRSRSKVGSEVKKGSLAVGVKSKYFFVISEFGYGKTRLLLELFRQFRHDGFIPLYFPVTAFEDQDFAYITNLCKRMIFLISVQAEYDISLDGKIYKIFGQIFKKMLSDPLIVIMFDGLDEHRFFGGNDGFRLLFNGLSNFKSSFIFSMRKSMWDDRRGDIESAVGRHRIIQDKIVLTEWINRNIAEYVQMIQDEHKFSVLDTFKHLVDENKHGKYYGDIPKRPLFLNMIISDLINHGLDKRSLYELYTSYFERKFILDKQGWFKGLIVKREFPLKGDTYKQCYTVMDIMDKIAFTMTDISSAGILELREKIHEKEIDSVVRKYGIDDILSLLLHSVLISVSGRRRNDMYLKFAHRSFHGFFLARYFESMAADKNLSAFKLKLDNESVLQFAQQITTIQEFVNLHAYEFEPDMFGHQVILLQGK